jgi:hypothetical protein
MCPGGCPSLQNWWQVALSRLRWVRLPRLPAFWIYESFVIRKSSFVNRQSFMEISLFQPDEKLRFERIVFYPYPDLKRIWARAWLTAVQDQHPNIEIIVRNPDGSENCSVYMMAHAEQRLETTLHLRTPRPGATYRVIMELTLGLTENPPVQDHHEFDLTLEFRNPDQGEEGFGVGVDWAELRQKTQAADQQ